MLPPATEIVAAVPFTLRCIHCLVPKPCPCCTMHCHDPKHVSCFIVPVPKLKHFSMKEPQNNCSQTLHIIGSDTADDTRLTKKKHTNLSPCTLTPKSQALNPAGFLLAYIYTYIYI